MKVRDKVNVVCIIAVLCVFSGCASHRCCPDAWDKVITEANDRFELVMGVGVDMGGGEILFEYQAVLDKETCLVWERSPNLSDRTWVQAIGFCYRRNVGGRRGWRAPTVEELATLLDPSIVHDGTAILPSGHPFDVPGLAPIMWSSTTVADMETEAWTVDFIDGMIVGDPKSQPMPVWCVRGGQGHDAY